MAKKKANGEGTIYKRPNGTWSAQVSYIDPGSGDRKRKTVSGKTKAEVLKKKRELEGLKDAGRLVATGRLTVEEWINVWLEDYMKGHLKPTTYSLYEMLARVHIIPVLGKMQLARLQTTDIQRFYNSKLESGRADGAGGLSPQTIHHMHKVIRGALRQATREGKLPRNPAENVRLPRMERKPIQPLSRNQVLVFLDKVKEDWLYPVFLTTLGSGLRRGEILGLQWQDLNLKTGVVEVNRELIMVDNRPFIQEDTKTDGSKRTVSLPALALDALKEYKDHQEQSFSQLGHELQDDDLIFTWPDGRAVSPNYLYHHFKDLLSSCELPNVRFHDLRHTFATLLLEAGEHPKVVADMLGHSSVRITLDTYSHTSVDLQARAASRLNDMFNKESDGNKDNEQ